MKVTPIRESAYVADRQREDAMIARERRCANKAIEEAERETIRTGLYQDNEYVATYLKSGRVRMEERLGLAFSGFCGLYGVAVMINLAVM